MASTAAGVSLRKVRNGMSPRDWRLWLGGPNAIAIFGAALVRSECKRLDKFRRRLESDVPSASWMDAYDGSHGAFEFPPGRGEDRQAVRMVVSTVTGRYTPPQCLTVEDLLDGMTAMQAEFYTFPESISAKVIRDIGAVGAKEMGGKWR